MRFFLLIVFLGLTTLPAPALAATIRFDPPELTAGMDSPFEIGINLDAARAVNVVFVKLTFSPGLAPVDISDGNSVVSAWIERPEYDPLRRTLTFSGMMVRGYEGVGGRLVTLSLSATESGRQWIALDESSVAYLNTPEAPIEPLSAESLALRISTSMRNVPNEVPDTLSPDPFVPVVSLVPDDMGRERWMVSFDTSDAGSGLDHYEVRESNELIPWFPSAWRTVESPALLNDQQLRSRVAVRAFDKAGNVREVVLPPQRGPWPGLLVPLGIMLALAGLFGGWWLVRRRRKPQA